MFRCEPRDEGLVVRDSARLGFKSTIQSFSNTDGTEAEDEQCCRTYRAEADRQFEANVVVLCGTEVPIPPRFHSTQAKDAAVLILNIVLNNKNVSAYQKSATKTKKTSPAGMTGNGTFPAQEMLAAALSEKRKKRAADS